jgi:hypothetical protein
MVLITRLFADEQGRARFEDTEISFTPENPPPDAMSVSPPWPASAVLFGHGPAGGRHAEQPEHRRQLVIGVAGSVEVTATGETRTFGPGDVLLVEDIEGFGHSCGKVTGASCPAGPPGRDHCRLRRDIRPVRDPVRQAKLRLTMCANPAQGEP